MLSTGSGCKKGRSNLHPNANGPENGVLRRITLGTGPGNRAAEVVKLAGVLVGQVSAFEEGKDDYQFR